MARFGEWATQSNAGVTGWWGRATLVRVVSVMAVALVVIGVSQKVFIGLGGPPEDAWVLSIALATMAIGVVTFYLSRREQRLLMEKHAETAKLAAIAEHDSSSIAIFDNEMNYVFASSRWYEQFQIEYADVTGKCHYDIFPEIREMPEWLEVHRRVLNGESLSSPHDEFQRDDGSIQYVKWAMMPWRDPESGEQIGAVVYSDDVTEHRTLFMEKGRLIESFLEKGRLIERLEREIGIRQEREDDLREYAQRDDLTGMVNRRHMTELLVEQFKRAEDDKVYFSVASIDVDDFKAVNDNYGHQVGDVVLKKIAEVIQHSIRASDIAARWGGEEFMILLHDLDRDSSWAIVERVRAAIEAADFGIRESVTISAGVSGYQHGETMEELIRQSDIALYMAKARGRNCVVSAE